MGVLVLKDLAAETRFCVPGALEKHKNSFKIYKWEVCPEESRCKRKNKITCFSLANTTSPTLYGACSGRDP